MPAFATTDTLVFTDSDTLANAIMALTANERRVIIGRYWQHQTQTQIAATMGVDRSLISRFEHAALDRLSRILASQRNELLDAIAA